MPKKNWSNIGAVTVVTHDRRIRFDHIEDAVLWIHRVSEWYRVNDYPVTNAFWRTSFCEVYDECDLRIPAWKLKEVFNNLPNKSKPVSYWIRFSGYDHERDFRNGPIAGTGKGRWSWNHTHRTYNHYGARLRSFVVDIDEDDESYGLRVKIRNLPKIDPWDDMPRGRRGRSWKHHRMTQFKGAPRRP